MRQQWKFHNVTAGGTTSEHWALERAEHAVAPLIRHCGRPQAGDVASFCGEQSLPATRSTSYASPRPELVVPWLVTRGSVWCRGNLAREIFVWSPIGTTGLDRSHDESLLPFLVILCLLIIVNATRWSDPKPKDVHSYKTNSETHFSSHLVYTDGYFLS